VADHKFIFGGADSSTYGIYISGEGVFNAPERAVEMISIPGRNGAIALDQGRFENIEVTYPAFNYEQGMSDFSSNLAGLRSALCSKRGYQRLTDTIHPDEFRLGVYRSGLEVTPVKYNTASDFNITFDCKPQRFLTSGETEVDGNAWSNVQTGSGSIVTIDNAGGEAGVKSLVANIEPIQSGSGTPSPTNVRPISGWDSVKVTKTGKNLLPYPYTDSGATLNGVTYSVSADGKIKLSGTATANLYIRLYGGFASDATLKKPVPHWLKAGTSYTLSGGQSANVRLQVDFYNGTASAGEFVDTGSGRAFTPTETQINDADSFAVFLRIANGTTVDTTISPMIRFSSESAEWEPFGTTKDIPLGRTVYKGTLDVVSGLLTVTHLGVDMGSLSWSYNATSQIHTAVMPADSVAVTSGGDTGAICSSYERGDYPNDFANGKFCVCDSNLSTAKRIGVKNTDITDATAFQTSVTGQSLVYTLATPQTYQLTPEEVDLLLGTNNIWADSGDITVQYGNSPVYNPTEFDAKPLIKVVGTGTAVVGDTAITITGTAGQTIYIDCDSMEIYKLNGGAPQSAASLVSFSGNDFPKLKAGSNTVALGTGITSVTITPRWWII